LEREVVAIPSYMTQEEKAHSTIATAGFSKEEKRKVQNKLAQRAFRKRNMLRTCTVRINSMPS
jgi:hypothetical protein